MSYNPWADSGGRASTGLILRIDGAWQGRPACEPEAVRQALHPHEAELREVLTVDQQGVELLIGLPAAMVPDRLGVRGDRLAEQIAADVASVIGLSEPSGWWRVHSEHPPEDSDPLDREYAPSHTGEFRVMASPMPKGAAGVGYVCTECGGVDSDHFEGCTRGDA